MPEVVAWEAVAMPLLLFDLGDLSVALSSSLPAPHQCHGSLSIEVAFFVVCGSELSEPEVSPAQC